MQHWQDIRRKARARHAAALAAAGGDPSAAALLAAAERLTGVARIPVPAGDPLLDGADALIDGAARIILFSNGVEPWRAAFFQAHEYAHLWLDDDHAACADHDMEVTASEEGTAAGPERVEGYGPRERREREANVFALEFLLPCPLLRRWYHGTGLDAAAMAARSGLPHSLVCAQLARALLAPPSLDETELAEPAESDLSLDPSQRQAAEVPCGPLLVEAGPGTGKTRTLVARILFLLQQGVPAASILALTFSQRAAEEMRARLATVAPRAAAALWIGTFHAFGLELLRKYGTRLGLPPAPEVLDPLGAMVWLERRLPELELDHYQNLYEPALPLREILAAISRAKDELIGPHEYRVLAEHQGATSGEETARAAEVARVYACYQEGLQREGLLDFGDLIARTVTLLRTHPEVRDAVRASYPHILVDEYQDVNRASGLLLRELAGAGTGLWVVGDARQAIYRFRGAAPANMRLFSDDFPGATVLALRHNYRSRPEIVSALAGVAPRMRAATETPFVPWQARRPAGGQVDLQIAANDEAEIAGVARAIEEQRARGLSYGSQAVLCRSHTALARMAAGLEAAGVPVLYLGDLFERPEVRDMLALLSLASEGDGHGLIRVAGFAEYAIPLADVMTLLNWAGAQGLRFPQALAQAAHAPGISPPGQEGLALLARHLGGLTFGADAWTLLTHYLFSRSRYLRSLAGDEPAAVQRRLALWQFLQFAGERRRLPGESETDPKQALLRYVRRLESFGEERGLRQVPEWAGAIDAVYLLTIHASKGLEFEAVYLPMLAQRYFPAPRRRETVPLPAGLRAGAATGEHDEEEECLFFVAISRARDRLCLSRAQRYGRQSSRPSRLLGLLGEALPGAVDGPVTWPAPDALPQAREYPVTRQPGERRGSFEVEALELYLTCPRRYYYAHELSLRTSDDSAYSRFRQCMRDVLTWAWEQQAQGQMVAPEAAQARLDEAWQDRGPHDDAYDALYRHAAAAMLMRSLARPGATAIRAGAAVDWALELPHGQVEFRPHRVEIVESEGTETIVVQQIRTARGQGGERQKRLAALYQAAAAQAHPTARRQVQTVSLSTAEVIESVLDGETVAERLGDYDRAIAEITEGRFAPRPDDRRCPRCPYYFICPSAEPM